MFKWVNKQKLQNRSRLSTATKSSQLKGESYPSSPAHSLARTEASHQNTSKSKIKIVLKSRGRMLKNSQDPQITKSQLIKLINKKMRADFHEGDVGEKSRINQNQCNVNSLLKEYCAAYGDIHNQTWGVYAVAVIMLKMGFITDLVQDRNIVKSIWADLKQPDILGLYTYLQKSMTNSVHIEQAALALKTLSLPHCSLLAAETILKNPYLIEISHIIRSNRNCRKKSQFR